MRIILPIKQVPETKNVKMDEETGTVIREGVEAIVNPLDLYSIELALRLKESLDNVETLALSMGPPKAEVAIKEAVAMGVDDGYLISDRVFGASDTWATSHILAKAIRKVGDFDCIICGERATDGDTGQVGPGIAAALDLPVITYLSHLEVLDDKTVLAHRMVEDGHQVLECSLPAVFTVVKEIGEPRLPTLGGKKRAKRMEITRWDHEILGIEPTTVGAKGSPTRVVKIFKPQVTRECVRFEAGEEQQVEGAVESLISEMEKAELIS